MFEEQILLNIIHWVCRFLSSPYQIKAHRMSLKYELSCAVFRCNITFLLELITVIHGHKQSENMLPLEHQYGGTQTSCKPCGHGNNKAKDEYSIMKP